jgi:hypothetical protein
MDLLDGLNPEQREAVTHIDGPLLVLAGPGSGKTRVITTRVAFMIAQGVKPWHILAMTFTNKAAGEMKHRVEQWYPGTEAQVSTFHSFGAWLLRRESEALGFGRDFTIYDTDDRVSVIRRIMRELNIDTAFVTANAAAHLISDAKNRDGRMADRQDDGIPDHQAQAVRGILRGDRRRHHGAAGNEPRGAGEYHAHHYRCHRGSRRGSAGLGGALGGRGADRVGMDTDDPDERRDRGRGLSLTAAPLSDPHRLPAAQAARVRPLPSTAAS